jgi:DNA repair exonuclease SbcCD ATPase subunit
MKYLVFLITLVLLFSCEQQKVAELENELEQLKSQNQMVREQSVSKDRFIEEYTSTLNDVYDNLETIRKREGLITEYSKSLEKSKQASVKEKMLSNLESIDKYISRSKVKLGQLKARFQESDMNSKAFEATIEKLTKELEEKEVYIAGLRVEIDSLNTIVSQTSIALQERELLIEEQNEQMNTAFYVIGSDDELEEKQIITEKGGLLGIGKTTVVSPVLSNNDFNTAKISETEDISINQDVDDIEIVSAHDPNSYELVGLNESESKLHIKNPSEFWKMRYLVIVTN